MQPFVFQDHAVKLHGRTYHYVPRRASREILLSIYTLTHSVLNSLLTGIEYFTFDALDAMLENATELNTFQNGVQVHTRTIPEIGERL